MSTQPVPPKFENPDDPYGALGDNGNSVGARTALEQNMNYRTGEYVSSPTGARITNDAGLPLILKENPSETQLSKTPELRTGVPSFINPYAVLAFPSKFGEDSSPYNAIIDDPTSNVKFSSPSVGNKNLDPTVYNLVNQPPDGTSNLYEAKTPYRYTDFLYCKHYGKIPNNYLITLRRYPAPTYDNLAIPLTDKDGYSRKQNSSGQSAFKPIAQAVTWIGEEPENKLSSLLGFEVNMNWKKVESQVESVYGNEQDASEGPKAFQGAAKFLAILNSVAGKEGGVGSSFDQQNSRYDPYVVGPYSNRVYGPVNVIASTFKRDRGLEFKQSFTLNFEYSLKSIANINPKAAMLDIMANMLTLTYNNAAFWGGANRYFAQKPVIPFLGGPGGMNAWYKGDPVGFSRHVGKAIAGAAKELSDLFADLLSDPIESLKKLAGGAPGLAMKLLGRGRAPDIVAFKALLTGEPIGEWHMVVGNPYSPILRVGNLICTGAKFQFNDTIGADNFPTELKVAISLEHGRPRDQGDIESMFNDGNGRIYYAPASIKDAFKSGAMKNSNISNSDPRYKGGGQLESPRQTGRIGNTPIYTSQNFTGPLLPLGKGTGNENTLAQIVDNMTYAFHGNGHDLAVKMGLASGGKFQDRNERENLQSKAKVAATTTAPKTP